ncbi:MAG TPA: hypothetical protein ACQGQI_10570, partial [Xylella sp.]
YGHQWASAYGKNPEGVTAATWATGLSGLTDAQVADGLRGLSDVRRWLAAHVAGVPSTVPWNPHAGAGAPRLHRKQHTV